MFTAGNTRLAISYLQNTNDCLRRMNTHSKMMEGKGLFPCHEVCCFRILILCSFSSCCCKIHDDRWPLVPSKLTTKLEQLVYWVNCYCFVFAAVIHGGILLAVVVVVLVLVVVFVFSFFFFSGFLLLVVVAVVILLLLRILRLRSIRTTNHVCSVSAVKVVRMFSFPD